MRLDRRHFLGAAAGVLAAPGLGAKARLLGADAPLKVGVVLTEFTYRSHAHVILENFLNDYWFNGRITSPGMSVVSFYVDQFPEKEMARAVAKERGIPIYPSIAEALCLGGKELAVDAVLAIGEHGNYPVNAKGQREYPRKRFFDEIVAVFKQSGRVAPVFNDKHLSYRWDWAKEMYDTSVAMKIPFMAGSSVPLAQRRPLIEIPNGAKMTEVVSIHAGPIESYDFHGLEVLQSFIESRSGGETGVARLQFLSGDNLWKAADAGRWSPALAKAAMAAELSAQHELTQALDRRGTKADGTSLGMHGILLEYTDGTRGTVLKVGEGGIRWNVAVQLAEKSPPLATAMYVGPWDNRNLFKGLSHAIQTHFRARRAPYPVERTLLVTGALDAAMDSRLAGETVVETPQLSIPYQAQDWRAMRENGETWDRIPPGTPAPEGLDSAALRLL